MIESIEVHLECDVCGDSDCIEVHATGDTYHEQSFEKALRGIGWTYNREHRTLRHLCSECATRLAREEAGDEGDDADEEEDHDA